MSDFFLSSPFWSAMASKISLEKFSGQTDSCIQSLETMATNLAIITQHITTSEPWWKWLLNETFIGAFVGALSAFGLSYLVQTRTKKVEQLAKINAVLVSFENTRFTLLNIKKRLGDYIKNSRRNFNTSLPEQIFNQKSWSEELSFMASHVPEYLMTADVAYQYLNTVKKIIQDIGTGGSSTKNELHHECYSLIDLALAHNQFCKENLEKYAKKHLRCVV